MVRERASWAAALAVLLVPALARGEDPKVKLELEAGSEVDSNPHRVDQGTDPQPITTAEVARAGAELQLAWRPAERRSLHLDLQGAGKKFTTGGHAAEEDVAVVAVAPAAGEAEAVTKIRVDRACSLLSLESGWARRRYFFCSFSWPTESSTVLATAGADSTRSTRPPV